jgi:hypothetical protein
MIRLDPSECSGEEKIQLQTYTQYRGTTLPISRLAPNGFKYRAPSTLATNGKLPSTFGSLLLLTNDKDTFQQICFIPFDAYMYTNNDCFQNAK